MKLSSTNVFNLDMANFFLSGKGLTLLPHGKILGDICV